MARKKKADTTNTTINTINNNIEIVNLNTNNINIDNNTIINPTITKSKRGRKPKVKQLENQNNTPSNNANNNEDVENILLHHSELPTTKVTTSLVELKMSNIENNDSNNTLINETDENNTEIETENSNDDTIPTKTVAKKRGRKPKGGKIVQQISSTIPLKESKPNIILHLKCHLKDLQFNTINNDVSGYDFLSNKNELSYEIISNNEVNFINTHNNIISNQTFNDDKISNADYDYESSDEFKNDNNNDTKEIWKKLKNLQYNLHTNNISDKKSACFWCTYEFDNPSIYIPKHFIKDSYHVYGCFCSPECATAYLMEENIDSSTKFERYHLLNHIYSKIYDYKKNIKPAPKPYYMLDKFYGNLTIQEYRSLLKNDRLFLVVDKPLTRIMPELHEDNDDFIINNKIIPSNTYQIKRKVQQKQQTKSNILNEKFGLASSNL
jgi:hypothetical protein